MLKQDLIEAVRSRKVLLVVGAGVSMAATRGNRLASWTGLLADGVARAAHFGTPRPRDPDAWVAARRDQLKGDLGDLLSVAEQVTDRLGGPKGGEFARWLGETVGQLQLDDTAVRDALRAWQAPIATTNYDDLLERSAGPGDPAWSYATESDDHAALPILKGERPARVLHLHGHYRRPETVILGIRDYQRQLGDAFAQAIQAFAVMDRTVVFAGFGAGLGDPNFAQLLGWFGAALGGAGLRHYRLCRTDEAGDAVNGVHAVPYGAGHADLAPFLRDIAAAAFPPVAGQATAPTLSGLTDFTSLPLVAAAGSGAANERTHVSASQVPSGATEVARLAASREAPSPRRVFIVHGHDEAARESAARLVERAGLDVLILHEQPNQGRTIIEKFERDSATADFAIVLLTPDDVGGPRGATAEQLQCRARQNVVAELFFFIGKLGREKVCALVKGDVELPSDFAGVVYLPMDDVGQWKIKLANEMRAAGLTIDFNKVFGR